MATLFRKTGNKLECLLCPHQCKINKDKTGICGARKNNGNSINLITYGNISTYALDPVEKKPLYHFFPGFKILSIGSFGCNMRCDCCQNYNISQHVFENSVNKTTPERIVDDALSLNNNIGIAFTYNEPAIGFEFIRDVALKAKEKGLLTVLVSNGYVNKQPLNEIISFTDAFNIDLKAFNSKTYKHLTGADIQPVKNTLKQIAKSGKHLEITTLIIPGQNDDEMEMLLESEWIYNELGQDVPFHLSRYFPAFKRHDPQTAKENMLSLFETASKKLNYVYIGNMITESGQDTLCKKCGTIVTERSGYNIMLLNLDINGNCKGCGTNIYKNFTSS